MILSRTADDLTRVLGEAREASRIVALVPTMGALHAGHARLFRAARDTGALVVASIFVNPKQFDDPRDFARYPRQEAGDAAVAEQSGVDVLFAPDTATVYPEGFATTVLVQGPALGFEGAHRPGHFDGVATVCLKLFTMVAPDIVYLGQKDAQQVAVLRQLVSDLSLSIDIRVGVTERDADGLAVSSRNVRLSPEERRRALAIPAALRAGLAAYQRSGDAVSAARAELTGLDVEYADVATFHGVPTLVIAARVGATRLIDNVPLDRPALAGL